MLPNHHTLPIAILEVLTEELPKRAARDIPQPNTSRLKDPPAVPNQPKI
jgi:hypothetical protein